MAASSELWKYQGVPAQLIPLLQQAQEAEGYISEQTIARISAETHVPPAKVYGVITFYTQFRLRPVGKFLVRVCDGTACHVNGSRDLFDVISDELGLQPGSDSTADGMFTVETVACIGCCSLAPVITVNEDTHGRLTPLSLRKVIKRYKRRAQKLAAERSQQLQAVASKASA